MILINEIELTPSSKVPWAYLNVSLMNCEHSPINLLNASNQLIFQQLKRRELHKGMFPIWCLCLFYPFSVRINCSVLNYLSLLLISFSCNHVLFIEIRKLKQCNAIWERLGVSCFSVSSNTDTWLLCKIFKRHYVKKL